MVWTSKQSNDRKFDNPPPGTYGAVCYRVIDLGTQSVVWEGSEKLQRKVYIAFEIDEKMEDGRPFVVGRKFTVSLHEKSGLRAFLKGWRGRDFTPEELMGFNPQKLIGAPCMLSLVQNGDYVNIASASKMPKGMVAPKLVNPTVYLSLDEFDPKVYEGLSNSMKEKISASPEYQAIMKGGSKSGFADMADDIPKDDEDIGF